MNTHTPLEKDYQLDIVTNLERAGLIVIRLNAGLARSLDGKRVIKLTKKGTPDLLVVCPGGRCVWLEVKRPGEQPSPAQRKMHARLVALGQQVAVVKSVPEALSAAGINHFW